MHVKYDHYISCKVKDGMHIAKQHVCLQADACQSIIS